MLIVVFASFVLAQSTTQCNSSDVVWSDAMSPSWSVDSIDWNAGEPPPSAPQVVAFAHSADGVLCALEAAVQRSMTIAVRAGRHDYCDFSVTPDALVVDVSNLTDITVLPSVTLKSQ